MNFLLLFLYISPTFKPLISPLSISSLSLLLNDNQIHNFRHYYTESLLSNFFLSTKASFISLPTISLNFSKNILFIIFKVPSSKLE